MPSNIRPLISNPRRWLRVAGEGAAIRMLQPNLDFRVIDVATDCDIEYQWYEIAASLQPTGVPCHRMGATERHRQITEWRQNQK